MNMVLAYASQSIAIIELQKRPRRNWRGLLFESKFGLVTQLVFLTSLFFFFFILACGFLGVG